MEIKQQRRKAPNVKKYPKAPNVVTKMKERKK